jgi:hypothetical protein
VRSAGKRGTAVHDNNWEEQMTGAWDASIKLLYAVDDDSFCTLDTVRNGDSFDVIVNVEIGEKLNEVVQLYDLWVSVRNLSQSMTILSEHRSDTLVPEIDTARHEEIRVEFGNGWSAEDGDVLEAVAAFKVTAGVNTDFFTARTEKFVVTA